jgi:hypothetical protein
MSMLESNHALAVDALNPCQDIARELISVGALAQAAPEIEGSATNFEGLGLSLPALTQNLGTKSRLLCRHARLLARSPDSLNTQISSSLGYRGVICASLLHMQCHCPGSKSDVVL